MRPIDADALEKEGWSLHRTIRVDEHTSEYQTKPLMKVPSAQPEPKWKRLMMHLADLQLTYSPNWGANGCGDQKLYEFVTGLIDELQGWEEGEQDG